MNNTPERTNPGFWRLVAQGEPFRLLFPLGTALGLLGVLLWPLHVWGVLPVYPGPFHSRIMIEGFLTAFVTGFLGTALPRLLDTPRLTLAETLVLAGSITAIAVIHFAGSARWGDILFFCTLAGFLGSLLVRALIFRQDVPPPAFVLVLLGMACALVGSATQALTSVVPESIPVWLARLSRLLLHQGYLIFPIMGIGAFLLPRFFGMNNTQQFPESRTLPPGWTARAAFAIACGALVLAGFVLEALDFPRPGNALRAAGILIYFVREVPAHRAGFGGGSLALGLRIALLSIPTAYATMAALPHRTFSLLHILFISGFSLLTFIVASRVLLGHSGQSDRFRARSWPVLLLTGLVAFAMLTRVSADWLPATQVTHYAYAALVWIVGVLIWAVRLLPAVALPDSE